MAIYYVDSNATGNNDGSLKEHAYTTLSAALSGKAAGDIFLVSHLHNETLSGSTTFASPGADDQIIYIISINFTNDTVTPGATINSATNGDIILDMAAYVEGLRFIMSGASADLFLRGKNGVFLDMRSCTFTLTGGLVTLGTTNSFDYHGEITLRQCNFNFNNAASRFYARLLANARIIDPDFSGSTASPYDMANGSSSSNGRIIFEGADLSVFGSSTELGDFRSLAVDLDYIRCKLPSGYSVNPPGYNWLHGNRVRLSQCSTNNSNCLEEVHTNTGAMTTNTGVYINDAGKPDVTGLVQGGVQISGLSWQVVTTSKASSGYPFYIDIPLAVWKASGAYSLYVEILYEGAQLTNNDVWLELNSADTIDSPKSTNTTPPPHGAYVAGLATPVNHSAVASTSDWVHGLTAPIASAVAAPVSPKMDGYIMGRLYFTVPNRTIFVNPQLRTA